MSRLACDRLLADGDNWGRSATTALGGRLSAQIIGIHATTSITPLGLSLDVLDATESQWVEHTPAFERNRLAYAKAMATSPQTLGCSLVDSPAGLLAWIFEEFPEWSDTADSPFETIPRGRFPDNVTLCWLTATEASAERIPKATSLSTGTCGWRCRRPSPLTCGTSRSARGRGSGKGSATSCGGGA